jgi:hypothetical protein
MRVAPVLGLTLLVLSPAFSSPRRTDPAPPADPRPAPTAESLVIRVVRKGEFSRVELSGRQLKVESSAGASQRAWMLTERDRQRLVAAALSAGQEDGRQSCGRNEVFITIEVQRRVRTATICDTLRPGDEPWHALLALLVKLLSEGR